MQNFFIYIGVSLLVFAILGIIVVLALERMLANRRSKPKTTNHQSFLDVIKQPNGEVPRSHKIREGVGE
jgi:ABC-type uncharacterized transport system permease subunit